MLAVTLSFTFLSRFGRQLWHSQIGRTSEQKLTITYDDKLNRPRAECNPQNGARLALRELCHHCCGPAASQGNPV